MAKHVLAGVKVLLQRSQVADQVMAEVEFLYILEDVQFDYGEFRELAAVFVVGAGRLSSLLTASAAKRLHLFLLYLNAWPMQSNRMVVHFAA